MKTVLVHEFNLLRKFKPIKFKILVSKILVLVKSNCNVNIIFIMELLNNYCN